MNESETRAEHIDPALSAAGWGVVEGSRIRREFPISPGRIEGRGRRGKPLIADYVLEYRNTRLAVIEAKAWDLPLTEGAGQAKEYAGRLAIRFAYASNGQGFYEIDMAPVQSGPPEREIESFPSPDTLWAMTFKTQNLWRDSFAAVPFEDKGGSHPARYYQEIAVRRVMDAIADGRDRILLTLATGTGKTFIAFQIAWKLFKSKWNLSAKGPEAGYRQRHPRILFLADRNVLANQAFNEFSPFPEDAMVRIEPDAIRKKGKVPTNGSLFFTIFQTFMASTGSATGEVPEEDYGAVPEPVNGEAGGLENLPEITYIREAYGYMYILACSDGSLYVGSTRNLRLRLEEHNRGEGARHTAARRPVKLVYYECFDRIDAAFEREKQVQKWSHRKKVALIKQDFELLKRLSRASTGSAGESVYRAVAGSTGSATGEVPEPVDGEAPEEDYWAAADPADGAVPEPVEGCFGDYPSDFFDLIIIDECHRGGARDESTWRAILEYFKPAVQLGMTATPKRRDNVDTYAYFGEPVYIYSLKEGINDGFLTPFRVKQIATSLDEYIYTPDDQVIEGTVERGRVYKESDFNRNIEIKARDRKRVEIFMDQIDQREKTLVFCRSQSDALYVRDYINQIKKSRDPDYCARVTADDEERGDQSLRDFQDNEKTIPTILTTSRKLSTGVDARNVRNIVLLREVNSIIEFKQIIGRGTRLYDGKEYFTIYDFVKAHYHFSDPEWDGEPIDLATCSECDRNPCVCETTPPQSCPICGQRPCVCEKQPCPVCGKLRCICNRQAKVKIKLADGKERTIQHMIVTTFWHPDGTPMTAQKFMESLFGKLPEFFRNETELRAIWSAPDTRRRLLEGLAEKGFGREQLAEMQKIIDAEKSDLFDVLAHIAYAVPPITRQERAIKAKADINVHFKGRQQVFLDFVLDHYVSVGVDELDTNKLTPLLKLKYNDSLSDALNDLGEPEEINSMFCSFQKYLYQKPVVA